jgi:hypothetical protein
MPQFDSDPRIRFRCWTAENTPLRLSRNVGRPELFTSGPGRVRLPASKLTGLDRLAFFSTPNDADISRLKEANTPYPARRRRSTMDCSDNNQNQNHTHEEAHRPLPNRRRRHLAFSLRQRAHAQHHDDVLADHRPCPRNNDDHGYSVQQVASEESGGGEAAARILPAASSGGFGLGGSSENINAPIGEK